MLAWSGRLPGRPTPSLSHLQARRAGCSSGGSLNTVLSRRQHANKEATARVQGVRRCAICKIMIELSCLRVLRRQLLASWLHVRVLHVCVSAQKPTLRITRKCHYTAHVL